MRLVVNKLKQFLADRLGVQASVLTITSPNRPFILLIPQSDGPIQYESTSYLESLDIDIVAYCGDPDTAMDMLDKLTAVLLEADDKMLHIPGMNVVKVLLGGSRGVQPIAGEPNNYVARQNVKITTETDRRK
jgi:hypothetical protein